MRKLLSIVLAVSMLTFTGCGQVIFTPSDMEGGINFCEANHGVYQQQVDTDSFTKRVYKVTTTCNNHGVYTYYIKEVK